MKVFYAGDYRVKLTTKSVLYFLIPNFKNRSLILILNTSKNQQNLPSLS